MGLLNQAAFALHTRRAEVDQFKLSSAYNSPQKLDFQQGDLFLFWESGYQITERRSH